MVRFMGNRVSEADIAWSIVSEIASKENIEPVEVEPSLGRVIDVEALDSVVNSMRAGTVTFQYDGYDVTVSHDRGVEIAERGDRARRQPTGT